MVVKLRPALGVVMIWLAAVAGVSVTAWVAIDRAGRDITNGTANSLSPLTMGTPLAVPTPGVGATSTAATTHSSATPERSAAPEASATPEPSATRKSPVAQAPPASPTSAAVPGSTSARDGTFRATGGQVSVRCTGDTIQLRIAQPDDGWRVEVGSAGPQEIHVTFMRGGEESGVGTEVTAVCAAGTPAFKVVGDS